MPEGGSIGGMDTGLGGKRVLITGGASGIGLGISKILAKEGMHIAIASRNPDPEAKKIIECENVSCCLIKADVSIEADVSRMVNEAEEKLGAIDCFVNNAAWTWHQPVTHITSESFQNTIDTNLRSCLLACKEIGKRMIARRRGAIVIIGSTVTHCAAYSEASYRISKMGLKMYMETLALELAPYNIRVNMVTPGHFVTRMTSGISEEAVEKLRAVTPYGRSGEPEEIGYAAAFLLSDKLSAFCCASNIVVDGGLTINPLIPMQREDLQKLNAL